MSIQQVLINGAREFGAVVLMGCAVGAAPTKLRAVMARHMTAALEEHRAEWLRARGWVSSSPTREPTRSPSPPTASPAPGSEPDDASLRRCNCGACEARRAIFRRMAS